MFKSIGGTLDSKKRNLIKTEEKKSDVSLVFSKFLDEYFSEYKDLFKWDASYNPQNGRVTIKVGSKLIAGELSLKVKELSHFLRKSNLRITQIIIV